MRENKLEYIEYDNIAYEIFLLLDKNAIKSKRTLLEIINYCGYGYPHRYNIMNFIRDTVIKNNQIPCELKKYLKIYNKWI